MGKVKLIDEFEFISEKPLKASSNIDLSFGHKEIVSVLKRIVKKTPESFTIGLYGDWGSGKSTIAVSLKEELKSDKIPLVIFDVWKHEGDSLRRTFLSLLVNDLKRDYGNDIFKSRFELSDRNKNSQVINEDKQYFNWKKIKNHSLILFGFSSVVLAPFFFTWLIFDFKLGWLDLSKPIGQFIVSGLSILSYTLYFKYMAQFLDIKKVTTNVDRFKDPHEFEEEFKRILKDGLCVSKIIIVFDNLDRVNGDKALEIMSTIKTFLDPIDRTILNKDVTFIIPCDEKAVKRHLKKSLNYSDDNDIEYERYSSEYLRKFFNSIIWIPEFYSNELEKLASKSLKETKIKELDNDDIAALIVLVFDKNPRQIIQYVNILTSNYLLIKERNIEGLDLNSDISQYAKYLLLIQTFPDIMNYLKTNSIYDLNEVIKLDIEEQKKLKNYDDFIKFLDLTNHIKIDSLDVFFKLRKSEFDVDFGNSDKLIRLIQTQEINNVIGFILADESGELNLFKVNNNDDINYIKDLNIAVKKTAFNSIIKQKLSKINNQILIAKFIDGLLSLMKYKDVELDINTYRTLNNKFKKGIESMYFINPDNLLTQVIDKISDNNLKNHFLKLMKDKWIFYINSFYNDQDDTNYLPSGYNDRLWDIFINKNSYFLESDFIIVKETIAVKLASDIDFIERISSNKDVRKKLSSSKSLIELLRTANFFNEDNVFESKIQNDEEILIISRIANVVSKYEDIFFNKLLNDSIYRFLNYNLDSVNNLN
ncbi:P-loop NTPase fold protein [Flavobacterium sp.]|uniref:P-loop NTPase fold protein n=1 Tax=Flavobacterium sp. TaxID=239 RepID=UPI002629C839|nr:P-loop NTPase fold protein [Flavobacterium sp.]